MAMGLVYMGLLYGLVTSCRPFLTNRARNKLRSASVARSEVLFPALLHVLYMRIKV